MNNYQLSCALSEEIHYRELLERYAEAATRGGQASEFLAKAFLSWMKGSKISLDDFGCLDLDNRVLFFKMLNIRWIGGWTENGLAWLLEVIEAVEKTRKKDAARHRAAMRDVYSDWS